MAEKMDPFLETNKEQDDEVLIGFTTRLRLT